MNIAQVTFESLMAECEQTEEINEFDFCTESIDSSFSYVDNLNEMNQLIVLEDTKTELGITTEG